ncbi:hypothetical protein AVEN_258112-1, partial [Araneus ventricosus]
ARSRLLYLSDGPCNTSKAEAEVLMAITGHGPTPHYHRQRASPSRYCTHQDSETPPTYPVTSHPRTLSALQWDTESAGFQYK